MKRKPGYLYILSCPSMPGLLKVGMTTRSPQQRAQELSRTTVAPTPFKVEYAWEVGSALASEKLAHQALAKFHHGKEFYRITVKEAVRLIEAHYRQARGPFQPGPKVVRDCMGPSLRRVAAMKQMGVMAFLTTMGLTSWASPVVIMLGVVVGVAVWLQG